VDSASRPPPCLTSAPAAIFILSGYSKVSKDVAGPAGWLAGMVSTVLHVSLPSNAAELLVKLAGVLELIGGLLIVLGQLSPGLDAVGAYIVLGLLAVFNALLVRTWACAASQGGARRNVDVTPRAARHRPPL
jgi:uncharacterized membrane protein YphA (DoxX/SURF4 family)